MPHCSFNHPPTKRSFLLLFFLSLLFAVGINELNREQVKQLILTDEIRNGQSLVHGATVYCVDNE